MSTMQVPATISGLPAIDVVPLCGIVLDYAPYIIANVVLSLIIYVGYIVIRWKFREHQEKLLFYIFLVSALQFGLNMLLFITHFSPDNGVIVTERGTLGG